MFYDSTGEYSTTVSTVKNGRVTAIIFETYNNQTSFHSEFKYYGLNTKYLNSINCASGFLDVTAE